MENPGFRHVRSYPANLVAIYLFLLLKLFNLFVEFL